MTNGEKNILIDTSVSRLWNRLQKELDKLGIKSIDYFIEKLVGFVLFYLILFGSSLLNMSFLFIKMSIFEEHQNFML